ncbi:MAG: murein hydrolase activator EnvC family protein [Culicoidibacterales bacterium]
MLKAKKFWVALVAVTLFVSAFPLQPLAADAACDSQAGCQALVTQLENEAKELDNQLAQISNEDKASLEEKMNLVNGYLRNVSTTRDEIETNIADLTAKSETLKEEATVIRDKVAVRMVHMQELSKGNILLDFLVNSESLSDFIQRAMTLTDLTAYDQQMLNQMQTKLTEIETNQAVIAESQTTIASLYATAQTKLTDLETIEANLVVELEKEAEKLVATEQTTPSESSQIVDVPAGVFTNPLPGGYLMFPWGVCGDDYFGKCHTGVDLGAYVGAPVVASASGVVTAAGTDGSRGNYVTISHDGATTQYYHLNSLNVSTGQSVSGGQMIGTMGATGFVTAPHLHFELWMNGVNVDPGIYVGY